MPLRLLSRLNRSTVLLTQHGKSSAVLIDVEDFQKMLDQVQLLEEIEGAKKELEEGKGMDHQEFINELRSKYSELSERKNHDHKRKKKRD